MKNPIAFLGGVLAYIAGITMVACYGQSLNDSTFNPEFTQSVIDKIAWGMLVLGCAGSYMLAGAKLTLGGGTTMSKSLQVLFLITIGSFLIGAYYTLMFGSPW